MDRAPDETREPSFRLFRDGTSLEEIAFKRTKLSKERTKVADAFQDAFELVGGVPRLALYADENYSEFARLYARMIPRDVDLNVSGNINIIPALPPTPLDGELVECGPSIDGQATPSRKSVSYQPPHSLESPKHEQRLPSFVVPTGSESKQECGSSTPTQSLPITSGYSRRSTRKTTPK